MSEENPTPLKRGDRVDHNWVTINKLNTLLQPALVELRRLGSAITDLRERPNFKAGGGGGGGTVQRFSIVSESGDYLTCQKQNPDGTLIPGGINVAKPLSLRVSTWQGQTIAGWQYIGTAQTRIATFVGDVVDGGLQAGDKITETLDPPYLGGELFASQATGETAVTVGAGRLTWIDLNVDARRYIAGRVLANVCVVINGVEVPRRVVLEGGPIYAP